MDPKETAMYRTKLFRDAVAWKKPDRIPNVSMFQLWQVLDAGYKLSEAMSDYTIMEKVTREHQEKYNFDMLVNTGVRNPFLVYKALGSDSYIINDENESINHTDVYYCTHDELGELAADYWKFIWEKAMPQKFPFWGGEFDLDVLQNAIDKRTEYFNFAMHINKVLADEYGMPAFCAPKPVPAVAIETVFSYIRGIKGMSIDMRKEPRKLEALIETLNEQFYYPAMEKLKTMPAGQDPNTCFDMGTTFLCQNMMSVAQWDKFYWPYLKPILDLINEKGWTYSIFPEGAVMRFVDYFKDYPKGMLSFMLENDDCFEFRKNLPNAAIMGGMSNLLLGSGSKQECIDLAKRLIDELGTEGGYMMTQTKIGTFRSDANPENLKAVCDFVLNYRP